MPAPSDYVDVAERLRQFHNRYPEGTLQSFMPPYVTEAAGKAFIVYSAAAYRTPDDIRPGIGWAWEPVPGPTSFTRDSELQNAETSAWGRAIVALGGFDSKHVASANEVRNRSAPVTRDSKPAAAAITQEQQAVIAATLDGLIIRGDFSAQQFRDAIRKEYGTSDLRGLRRDQADELIRRLRTKLDGHSDGNKPDAPFVEEGQTITLPLDERTPVAS